MLMQQTLDFRIIKGFCVQESHGGNLPIDFVNGSNLWKKATLTRIHLHQLQLKINTEVSYIK